MTFKQKVAHLIQSFLKAALLFTGESHKMVEEYFNKVLAKARNTRLEMTADLREKNLHILKSTSMKQQENPADFSSVHKVQAFLAQICCHFTPCISRFSFSKPRFSCN